MLLFEVLINKTSIPLLADSVSAGFPSPADDYIEENIDLNEHLLKNPFSTFFLRVKGDSMIDSGIYDRDLIIVDKSLNPKPGNIVIAMIDGEFTVKRFLIKNNQLYLKAENHNYPDLNFEDHNDIQIWGVVIYSIHDLT
ncbi:MAG: peptidase S24 [Prochlorococcus sp. SP3034]|nr:peptidase S24 [Prochlorococcus sp. SP3034]|tara:strand:- start:5217 stop:5633 length:417 start_codon:yes stop_codon:yes gene_type:complete